MKAMESRMLPPFFGNFKSEAKASSEIIGRPEAIRNGKNDAKCTEHYDNVLSHFGR